MPMRREIRGDTRGSPLAQICRRRDQYQSEAGDRQRMQAAVFQPPRPDRDIDAIADRVGMMVADAHV